MKKEECSITRKQLAARWGISLWLLEEKARRGDPLPKRTSMFGNREVRYMLTDVEEFERNQGVKNVEG
jgi:hypothetical protein